MSFRRLLGAAVVFLAFQCAAFSQDNSPAQPPMQVMAPMPVVQPLETIAVPYDAIEPVTGDVKLVQTAEERAQLLEMFMKGRRLSNVRQFPYLLKTTFTAYGSQSSSGSWSIEDTSPGAGIYRWAAQGPSFSGIFLQRDGLLSSNQADGNVPLRLAQVRDAMWSEYFPGFGPHAALFTSTGTMSGAEVRCVLIMRGVIRNDEMYSLKRSFNEEEYCFDPQSGLLASYSPIPGYFVRYDYSAALHFHDRVIIPNTFTIYEAGKPIVEARTESVGDPASTNDAIFEPSGLRPLGTGQVVDPMVSIRSIVPNFSTTDAAAQDQVVVVSAMISARGDIQDREVILTTDESLDEVALDHITKSGIASFKASIQQQAGTTPRSQAVIFAVEVVPERPRPVMQRCPPDGSGARLYCR